MIEITVKYVDGVRFVDSWKVVEPIEVRHGVQIERVSRQLLEASPGAESFLKMIGLKRVEVEPWTDVYIYAFYPMSWLWLEFIRRASCVYWRILRWLYNNARMFKQIPEGEMFSWRYSTPYTWLKRIHK